MITKEANTLSFIPGLVFSKIQTLQAKKSTVKVHTHATVPFYLATAPGKFLYILKLCKRELHAVVMRSQVETSVNSDVRWAEDPLPS